MCGPVTHQVQFLQERTQIADIYILTLGESSKKNPIFYGQADRKGEGGSATSALSDFSKAV